MKHKLLAPDEFKTEESKTELFGVEINNPLGLAAGFDKNGELIDSALEYGFGYVEVGSVTYEGGKGNEKPRLFRLHKEKGLLNRMGLNGDPAEIVAERLKTAKSKAFGVNIAKTHSPDILGDKAIADFVNSYKLLKSFGIYTVINISCPNTREGRTFEDPASLRELLSAISEAGRVKPILLKLSPVIARADNKLTEVVSIAEG
ncbi:MAG: quinone-dependent dihydroorotate dehydrogenase, partial [Candidatus Levybacteria bacterium]|nr:quinone-dependent dihydroorotate dehydrogenase [Candidatus Levybacteria bacterium]